VTLTSTPSNTPTVTPTPTATPILFAYDSSMSTPIKGVGLEELSLIISQLYNVPNMMQDTGHQGVDLGSYDFKGRNLTGNPILSVFTGKVACVTFDRPPLGNFIIVETPFEQLPEELTTKYNVIAGQSLYTLYGHMLEAPSFQVGDKVDTGQQIGKLGDSQTAEAHLHLEMRVGSSGQTFPSMAYYSTEATQVEKDTYLRWRTSGQFIPYDPLGWLKVSKP
jgi:murein DD-endopeptidase MepM/ murein hydrolase activator NlpD